MGYRIAAHSTHSTLRGFGLFSAKHASALATLIVYSARGGPRSPLRLASSCQAGALQSLHIRPQIYAVTLHEKELLEQKLFKPGSILPEMG